MPDNQMEEHIAATQPDAFVQPPGDQGVHGKQIIAEPEDGKEKEAALLSRHAGASSEAPASSGIPSAMRQHSLLEVTEEQDETAAANHVISMHQDTAP